MNEKKETWIPIFSEGKQSHRIYNQLILETLLIEGNLTDYQIAKTIASRIGTLTHTLETTKTQKAYSVLIRKDGRLSDLEQKGYIMRNDDKTYEIRTKGAIAILIKKPELFPLFQPQLKKAANEMIQPIITSPDDKVFYKIKTVGTVKLRRSFVSSMKKQIASMPNETDFFLDLVKATKHFIEELGINLDRITIERLEMLLSETAKDYRLKKMQK